MKTQKSTEKKERYVYVKDQQGTQYICRASDLKKPDEISEEEKDACMIPPGDA
jgi:hypothetical protein